MKNKILLLLLSLMPIYAGAVPITWQLENVTVGGGANGVLFPVALTGSFVYDADLNLYGDVDITSLNGVGWQCIVPDVIPCNMYNPTNFTGGHYDFEVNNISSSTPTSLVALDLSNYNGSLINSQLLFMTFASSLTNAGGSIAIGDGGVEYVCENDACSFDVQTTPFRGIVSEDVYDASHTVILATGNGRVISVPVSEPSILLLMFLGFAFLLRRHLVESKRHPRADVQIYG